MSQPHRSRLPFTVTLALLAILLQPRAETQFQTRTHAWSTPAAVWQYSIPLEPHTERRAYLWIPTHCTRVRAVFFGLQNMMERDLFEDPEIRATATTLDMAIVLVSPGAWPDKTIHAAPSIDNRDPQEIVASTERVLTGLALQSGYTEIQYAPLLVTGHSAASPFIWALARALPNRVFAFLPFKGYLVESVIDGLPTLKGEQEWAEWGPNWGEVWRKDLAQAMTKVDSAQDPLFGDFPDLGSGHFDWHHDAASVLALFMRKAVAARIPGNAPRNAAVLLKPITAASGVLVDPTTLGTTDFSAIPYPAWKGNPQTASKPALWYFDREMARAVNRYMLTRLQKQPEAIDFVVDGKPADLSANGFAVIKPQFLPDDIHFRVHAEPLLSTPHLFGGQVLGHASTPITYRVSSGALQQTGPETFRVAARSGGLTRQGLPWEPWIMAYQAGDATYRSADRPAHILIDIRNKTGEPQSLTFPKLGPLQRGARSLPLAATVTSGLPVQFYVESGPAVIEGNTLRLLPIPPRSRYPVRILVSAFQWGRAGEHPIQSAGPDTQEVLVIP